MRLRGTTSVAIVLWYLCCMLRGSIGFRSLPPRLFRSCVLRSVQAMTMECKIPLSLVEAKLIDLLLNVVKTSEVKNTELRIAGGWVRDKVLRLPDNASPDIDIAIDNMSGVQFAESVKRWLRTQGEYEPKFGVIPRNPDQSKHLETVTMNLLGLSVDFVNLRTEEYAADSRIPEISVGTPTQDAERRDFTINALFYNLKTGQVEDFTKKGLKDLRDGVIRTPLEPSVNLLDDPLRVFRAVRFSARFDFRMCEDLLVACSDRKIHAAIESKVSKERIGVEINRMLLRSNSHEAWNLIHGLHLLPVVFQVDEKRLCANINLTAAFERAVKVVNVQADMCSSGKLKSWLHLFKDRDAETKRDASLAAILSSFTGTIWRDMKKKKVPFAVQLLLDSLKMSNKVASRVATLHEAMLRWRDAIITERSGSLLPQKRLLELSSDSVLNNDNKRVLYGRIMRKTETLWAESMLLALACDIVESNDVELSTVDRYTVMYHEVEQEGLHNSWNIAPLLNGTDVATVLPKLPKGPVYKEVMEYQVDWMLRHPAASASMFEEDLRVAYKDLT